MTFLALYNKLGKQPVADNKQTITAVISVRDLQELCKGKPNGACVEIPLALKFCYVKGAKRKIWFVRDDRYKKPIK